MKSILLSIKPKWVAKILNGEKTIEIRKTCPTQLRGDTPVKPEPIDVYIYCTKKGFLYYLKSMLSWAFRKNYCKGGFNGKVVAKFTLNKVEEIKTNLAMRFFTESANEKELLEKSCLNSDQLFWYLAPQELKVKCCGYAWHIDDLVIFDKPKKLSEFKKNNSTGNCWKCKLFGSGCSTCQLTKAPQSWCYVEV